MTKKKIIGGIVGGVCLIVLGIVVCFTQKVFFEDTNMAKIRNRKKRGAVILERQLWLRHWLF